MITAQDKILHVANKLGLTSLKDMQASTGAIYDVDRDLSGQIFTSVARHQNPSVTNLTENQFEVNEALLVENISFYVNGTNGQTRNMQKIFGSASVIVFDLIIGNKRVMKDTPVFSAGGPYTFANVANSVDAIGPDFISVFRPRSQVFMESVGVLIPPQVQFYIEYKIFNVVTGAPIALSATEAIGCYLYGTKVNLNFNTTI